MDNPANSQNVSGGINIPPRPQLLLDIQSQLDRVDCTVMSLGKLIMREPVVASKIVRSVNSPAFGLRRKVESIEQAVGLLGMTASANIVSGFCLQSSMDSNEFSTRLWDCSEKVALTSYFLCHFVGCKNPDLSYMIGLFHDCGMALLQLKNPDYPDIVAQGYAGTELGQLTKYEKGFMDTHHAVTGYYVAKSWQLPATAARIIRDHHNCLHYFDGSESIEPTDKDMMAILVMASHIAGTHKVIGGQEKDYEWERLKPLVLEHFKITDEQFAEIAQLG